MDQSVPSVIRLHPATGPAADKAARRDCGCASAPTVLWPMPTRLPVLPQPPAPMPRQLAPQRRKLWDLGKSLHCSIIGTCLSADDLRRLLRRMGREGQDRSDHELHALAVGLAGQPGPAAKLLHKALDERHRATIRRFDTATDREALRLAWRAAADAGDISGAYWTVLTHPQVDQALIVEIFGEVHMLSHLIGSANRADIRRLATQEKELAALRDAVARQQEHLRSTLTDRDARIRALQDLLASQSSAEAAPQLDGQAELHRAIADLQQRLTREIRRRESLERREAATTQALQREKAMRQAAQAEGQQLVQELAAAEQALAPEQEMPRASVVTGAVLYVGGRSGQTALLRQAAARHGVDLLHHDAEQGNAMLPGLISRVALVVFPVDCVSHEAALGVKRLCRQLDRPFRALRTTGVATLLAALLQPQQAAVQFTTPGLVE